MNILFLFTDCFGMVTVNARSALQSYEKTKTECNIFWDFLANGTGIAQRS